VEKGFFGPSQAIVVDYVKKDYHLRPLADLLKKINTTYIYSNK
jgi:hypothetical protein